MDTPHKQVRRHHAFAPHPPMGWNSWDCFGTTLTEAQALVQATKLSAHLKQFGWNIFTVDIQWYEPSSKGHDYQPGAILQMDAYSRLLPAETKFPSATGGAGFKPLADKIHRMGLKFGIHIMRGIPRQAVHQNTAILGTNKRAADIAIKTSTCAWNPDMYGVDVEKPGGQEYYNSLIALYASWGVDFLKVDDISRPYDAIQVAEVEAIRKAIDACGRPIVLSLSPGDTPLERSHHVVENANMWRISDDFWDRWEPLHGMFDRLHKWAPIRKTGAWPDADMLPFGTIEFTRQTRFTPDEQRLCMTLWSIARSPLILGADLTRLNSTTLSLLTNPDVIAVNQNSSDNRQLYRRDDIIAWTASVPKSKDIYVALFNAQDADFPYSLDKAASKSGILRGTDGNRDVAIRADIKGANQLILHTSDAGDGLYYDHAAWLEPTLHGPAGVRSLTDIQWKSATQGFGKTLIDLSAEGKPLTFNGHSVKGIGTHAPGVIVFDVPAGYDTFTARGCMAPGHEGKGSVEFFVLTDAAKRKIDQKSNVAVEFSDLGIGRQASVRDLWAQRDLGKFSDRFVAELPLHGAGLFRISPR